MESQLYGQFGSYAVTFLMSGIPTFFVTRKYGKNSKLGLACLFIPIPIWLLILIGFNVGMGDRFFGTLGQTVGLTIMFGTAGYFVFRRKQKIKNV